MLRLFFLFLSIFFVQSVVADDKPRINLNVIPDSGTNDTKFFMQITVSGESIADFKMPNLKDDENFSVAVQSTSIQDQQINGVSTQQKTFVFSLKPKSILKEGSYNTPHGSVEYKGESIRLPSKKITIESSRNFIGSALKSPTKDGFNFIQLISNEKPYVGEQVSYRVEIIAPTNLIKAELDDFQVEGVWRERFGQDEKRQRQAYNITIHSFSESWFPIQSGVIQIPERRLNVALQEVRRVPSGLGLSNQLLNSLLPLISQFSTQEKTVVAPPISFTVKPLPPPASPIMGHIPVGKLTVTSSIDKDTSKVGDPITLTIQVSGDANLKPLELGDPINKINENEFKRYDEKPIIKKDIKNPDIFFYKTFSVTLIPLTNGNLNIPRFTINWFDPKEEGYKFETTVDKLVSVVGEPVVLPKIEEAPKVEIDKNLLRKVYGSTQSKLSGNLALISFLISIFLPLLVLIKTQLVNNFKRIQSSPKKKLNIIIKEFTSNQSPSALDTLSLLKNASSVLLQENCDMLTANELSYKLSKTYPKLEDSSSILGELENLLYSSSTILSSGHKTKAHSLLKDFYAAI